MLEILLSNEPLPPLISFYLSLFGVILIAIVFYWINLKLNEETIDPSPKHENTL